MMNRYVTLQQLGDGTYGSVVLGQRVDTGEKVSRCFEAAGGTLDYRKKVGYSEDCCSNGITAVVQAKIFTEITGCVSIFVLLPNPSNKFRSDLWVKYRFFICTCSQVVNLCIARKIAFGKFEIMHVARG